jgi:hypothetical protein
VGDVDDRRIKLLVKPLEFGPHIDAQFGVEVRERLVHQEHVWVTDDSASDGHPLSLPTGHLAGHPVEHCFESDDPRGLVDSLVHLFLREITQSEPK